MACGILRPTPATLLMGPDPLSTIPLFGYFLQQTENLLSFLFLVWFSILNYLSSLFPHFNFSLVEMASDKSPYEMNVSDLNFKSILIYSYFSLSPLTTRNKMAVQDDSKTLFYLLFFFGKTSDFYESGFLIFYCST